MANLLYQDGVSIGNRPSSAEQLELSGIARAQKAANAGHLWSQTDGAVNKIFALRSSDAQGRGAWTLTGAVTVDPEDIASATVGDQPYVYLADTGDNSNARASIVVYRIKEPTITGSDGALAAGADYEAITCIYPAGNLPDHKDAECLLVDPDTGDVYILTKRITPARLYRLPHAANYVGTQTLEHVGTIWTPAAITIPADGNNGGYYVGGDISADGTSIVLKSFTTVYTFARNKATQTIFQALQSAGQSVPAYVGGGRPSSHPNNEPQGEAICFDPDGHLWTASEYKTAFGSTPTANPVFFYRRHPTAAIEASFQDGSNSYTGTSDTYIWSNPANQGDNRGAEATFVADYDSPTSQRYGLLKFDLSSLPANAVVIGCDLLLNIDVEGSSFRMHRMLKAWSEASTYLALGAPAFDDAYATAAEDAKHSGYAGITGPLTIKVPIATVQNWLDGLATNNGWIFYSDDIAGGNGFQFRSRQHATVADRPKLVVRYLQIDPTELTLDVYVVPERTFTVEV